MKDSLTDILSEEEQQQLCAGAVREVFKPDDIIFEEGDQSEKLYLLESGEVSVYIRKYLETQEISRLGPGQCLGEMGVLQNSARTASAIAIQPTTLLAISTDTFSVFMLEQPEAAQRVKLMVEARNAEMALKESVITATALDSSRFHISMKGDPSLRESVFSRERYYSIVDEVLLNLLPMLEEILLERNGFFLQINFNSGEISILTVFDPFTPEIHAANRLVSATYVDRHFPKMEYAEKTRLINQVYNLIANDKYVGNLSSYWQSLFVSSHANWEPVPPAQISMALNEIHILRNLEQYYLRNISISTVRDVIRMQFNCDGTHIVNSNDYQAFLRENLI